MNNKSQKEPQRMAQLMLLGTYTLLVIALVVGTIMMSWEKWALPLIVGSVIVCWFIHIRQKIEGQQRMWIYTVLMMEAFFFYGIHLTSTYDMAPLITMIMIIYTIAGESRLITFCEVIYFILLINNLIAMSRSNIVWDSLIISRTALHIVTVLFAGWLARFIVSEWDKAFYDADRQIEELNQSAQRMNAFLSNLSHELRTPINAIVGTTEVMQDNNDHPEIREQLLSVRYAANRLTSQVNDIMDYSELETGSLIVNNEPYLFASMVNDVIEEMRPYISPKVELIVNVDAFMPSGMISDVRKIRRILYHLIGNALNFTKEGGVYVKFSPVSQDYGVNLCIEIIDTGIGMKKDDIERVSNRYYQTEVGKTIVSGGLGLGIPIANGFIRALGGFMLIDSKENEGTSIRISIPQKVYDSRPCLSVNNKQHYMLGGYLDITKFSNPQVREFYNACILNIVQGLGTIMHRVDNEDDLKKLISKVSLTHLIVGIDEYLGSKAYLESIAESVCVLVVAPDSYVLPSDSKAYLIAKPFTGLVIANILNMNLKQSSPKSFSLRYPGIRALVVDDEPMNLAVASNILGRYGMKVSTAGSGQEAVDLCAEHEYDIIFMDHMMPEMDGVEAMQRIRVQLQAEKRDIPIIALTANALSGAKEMFMSEGFEGFVSKPIETSLLERVLRRVLPEPQILDDTADVMSSGVNSNNVPRANSVFSHEEKATGSSVLHKQNAGAAAASPSSNQSRGMGSVYMSPDYESDNGNGFQVLAKAGINTSNGLYYCQQDENLYQMLLQRFANDYPEKRKNMDECCKDEDLKGYTIIVHALKSTAKMIGADSLSTEAYEMEKAAKKNDAEYVLTRHEGLMEQYKAVSGSINMIFGEKAPTGNDAEENEAEAEGLNFEPGDNTDEEESFEFFPEGGDEA